MKKKLKCNSSSITASNLLTKAVEQKEIKFTSTLNRGRMKKHFVFSGNSFLREKLWLLKKIHNDSVLRGLAGVGGKGKFPFLEKWKINTSSAEEEKEHRKCLEKEKYLHRLETWRNLKKSISAPMALFFFAGPLSPLLNPGFIFCVQKAHSVRAASIVFHFIYEDIRYCRFG